MLFTFSWLENAVKGLIDWFSLKISQIGKIAFAAQICAKKITLEVFNPRLHVRITWELKKNFFIDVKLNFFIDVKLNFFIDVKFL